MNFRIGPSPEIEFDHTGWNQLFGQYTPKRRPNPILGQIGALLFSAVLLGWLVWLIGSLLPHSNSLGLLFGGEQSLSWWQILAGGLLLAPLHELLHAAFHPGWGMTEFTTLGFMPNRLAFYAHYEGESSRTRLLFGVSAPFTVLSLLPIALSALGIIPAEWQSFFIACSLLNGLISAGDLLTFVAVLVMVPRAATVRRFGWRLFWRIEE